MSKQVITVFAPRAVRVPRGADWAAAAVVWFLQILRSHPAKAVLR